MASEDDFRIYGRLVKIASVTNAMRTDSVDGFAAEEPREGARFSILGEPIDPTQDLRLVWTSPVDAILSREGSAVTFQTFTKSVYRWEWLSLAPLGGRA